MSSSSTAIVISAFGFITGIAIAGWTVYQTPSPPAPTDKPLVVVSKQNDRQWPNPSAEIQQKNQFVTWMNGLNAGKFKVRSVFKIDPAVTPGSPTPVTPGSPTPVTPTGGVPPPGV